MGVAEWWSILPTTTVKTYVARPTLAVVSKLRSKTRAPPSENETLKHGYSCKGFFQYASSISLNPSLISLSVPRVFSTPEEIIPVKSIWTVSKEILALEHTIQTLVQQDQVSFQLTKEGCGGVYFLMNQKDETKTPIAVMKPRDEEYMAPANPRGYVVEHGVVGSTEHPTNKGFRIGNGALRERAVYAIDELYQHFSGVPRSTYINLSINGQMKEASVQEFVVSECSAEDMGPLKFSVHEIQKIGILDLCFFNTDRHAGNILLSRERPSDPTFQMTPIDHGFCLPSYQHLENACFEWLQWPQARYPFTTQAMSHIESLDIERDCAVLRELGIEEECIVTYRICTMIVKYGAKKGYSLYDLGNVFQRQEDFSKPSILEEMVKHAMEKMDLTSRTEALMEEVSTQMELYFTKSIKATKVRCISNFQ